MRSFSILLPLFILLISCNTKELPVTDPESTSIRINQVGYYPESIKELIVADHKAESFRILDENGNPVFKGKLLSAGLWEASGEDVLTGSFTNFQAPGTYTLWVEPGLTSSPFEIKPKVYEPALNASIKSFYFQRASMSVKEQYGGIFKRAAGHADVACSYHPSSGIKGGKLDSPGGWYDAGDYGKYVVNAAITVGQMLNLLEIYPDVVKDAQLNIPESGNGISDLLDEIRYELDWMLTMQDSDGGVFHKLTAKNFGGFIMPEDYDMERLIIGKGTYSSLGFAAVMAQVSRIYKDIDPDWANMALVSAERAWDWAVANDNVPFRNPEDVRTGEYGDSEFSDDFYWAAAELYVATGKELYVDYLRENEEPYIHQLTNSWKYFIRNMGFHTLLANRDRLDPGFAESLVKKHLELSDQILAKIDAIPYNVGLDHFEWGSNSDVLNQAMILCFAHHISGEQKYLDGAIRNMDYILGKNATGYCFLTGFGSKRVMNPHHRPSGADGIEEPVPGFIVGGPNNDRQDRREVEYASEFPARAFEDVEPSYASNEVCLNWNAPAVFVLGYLEQIY
ncbi:MAG: glycoside hydrolase family 9 protein [Bacteroidales bacterium]|nr:glycoside hydrolase family 9 protein [Bacteroidales bacterium]